MRRATLLISRSLFEKSPELTSFTGTDFRLLLRRLLMDPDLWKKVSALESKKYTKTYQADGLDLVPIKFYPFASDWCELSALSNGTGFSRCYIFIYLLEIHLGLRDYFVGVTNPRNCKNVRSFRFECRIKVSKEPGCLKRNLRNRHKNKKIRIKTNIIPLKN